MVLFRNFSYIGGVFSIRKACEFSKSFLVCQIYFTYWGRKGNTSYEKKFFWALPERGGGILFYIMHQSLKLVKFYPKPLIIVCYLVIFCHHYHQNYHHSYHCNRHYHHQQGGGRGRGNLGNAQKKTLFFVCGVP